MPTTHFEWDPITDNIVAEYDENGEVIAEYTYESGYHGKLISELRGGVSRQYHFDAAGNTVALTNDSEEVTDAFAYSAFGQITERTGSTPTPFTLLGAAGRYTDLLTGAVNVDGRPYAPAQGRWLTIDAFHSVRHSGLRRDLLAWATASPYSFIALVAMQDEGKVKCNIYGLPVPKITKKLEITGKCGGATFEVQWFVDEASRKAGGGGVVIQLVDVEWKVTDCCGAPKKDDLEGTFPQWEAWKFDADPETEDVMEDIFQTVDQGKMTKGSVKYIGKAAAFLNYTLPADFKADFKPPFGKLPHSKNKPPCWDEADDPYVSHELFVEWNCCVDPIMETKATTKPSK